MKWWHFRGGFFNKNKVKSVRFRDLQRSSIQQQQTPHLPAVTVPIRPAHEPMESRRRRRVRPATTKHKITMVKKLRGRKQDNKINVPARSDSDYQLGIKKVAPEHSVQKLRAAESSKNFQDLMEQVAKDKRLSERFVFEPFRRHSRTCKKNKRCRIVNMFGNMWIPTCHARTLAEFYLKN